MEEEKEDGWKLEDEVGKWQDGEVNMSRRR